MLGTKGTALGGRRGARRVRACGEIDSLVVPGIGGAGGENHGKGSEPQPLKTYRVAVEQGNWLKAHPEKFGN